MIFSADDTCDVGTDGGALVADDYPEPRSFNGEVNWVEIALDKDAEDAEDADHFITRTSACGWPWPGSDPPAYGSIARSAAVNGGASMAGAESVNTSITSRAMSGRSRAIPLPPLQAGSLRPVGALIFTTGQTRNLLRFRRLLVRGTHGEPR